MSYIPYEDLATFTKPGKNIYDAETYVGNWYEETVRNTLKRDDFLRQRECGDLTIQRTQTMVDLLLKPVETTLQMDDYLHYGDKIQIVAAGPTCKVAKNAYPFKRHYCKIAHLALSASVPPTVIDHAPYLSTDSIISASPLLYPVVRNTFIIEHPDCPDEKKVMQYGDVFRIRAFDTQHFKLYLFSAPAIRVHSLATHSAKPKVRFSDLAIQETLWTTFPLDEDSKLRMELGINIRLRTPLLIRHNGSGNNLSYESMFSVLTYFGCEMEVTLDTKLDTVRRPSFENIWYFDTFRGLPKDKDPCSKDFEKQAEFSNKINVNRSINQPATEKEMEGGSRDEDDEQDQNDDEQECNNECSQQGQMSQGGQGQQRQYGENDQIPRAQDVLNETDKMMAQLSLRKLKGGQAPFDPMTGPQPNAYSYKVQDGLWDGYANFPNQKWDCGNTNCCRIPPIVRRKPQEEQEMPDCKCKCIEQPPKPFGPNETASSSLRHSQW